MNRDDAKAPLQALVREALAAMHALGAGLSDFEGAVAYHDAGKDEVISALPSFDAAVSAMSQVPEVVTQFGAVEAGRLVLQFVYHTIGDRAETSSDQDAFNATWGAFTTEVERPDWIARGVANVEFVQVQDTAAEGIATGNAVDGFRLGPGVQLIGRSSAALTALGFGPHIWEGLLADLGRFGASSFVLVVESFMPKAPDNVVMIGHPELQQKVDFAVLALRLLAPGAVGIGPLFITRAAAFNVGGGTARLGLSRGAVVGTPMTLTRELAARSEVLAAQLRRFFTSASAPANIALALRSFSASYGRQLGTPGDAVIDLVTALEALLGTEQEISFRLAFRVSSLLAPDDQRRVDLFGQIRSWYDLRSKLVHGANLKAKHRALLADAEPLRRVVAELLRGFVTLHATSGHGFDRTFFQEHLDASLLAAHGRDDLRSVMGLDTTSVIRRLVAAMNAHDLDGVVALMHPDYHSEQPAHPAREFGSSAQVRSNWEAMFSGIPDFHAELLRCTENGAICWSEWHWSGTRIDGELFDVRGVALFEVRDDRIAAARLYMEQVEHDGGQIEQAVDRFSGRRPRTAGS